MIQIARDKVRDLGPGTHNGADGKFYEIDHMRGPGEHSYEGVFVPTSAGEVRTANPPGDPRHNPRAHLSVLQFPEGTVFNIRR